MKIKELTNLKPGNINKTNLLSNINISNRKQIHPIKRNYNNYYYFN